MKKVDEDELINYWLNKFHNTNVEEVAKKHPRLSKNGDWYKKYLVTQEQHDDWEIWAKNHIRKISKISKHLLEKSWWSIYLNYAPSVKQSKIK